MEAGRAVWSCLVRKLGTAKMLGVINWIRICFRNILSAASRANGRADAGAGAGTQGHL